jgi:hypothetical protein
MAARKKRYKLVDASCDFWFNDNSRVASPFPVEIQVELKKNAQAEYGKWLKNLSLSDKNEIEDEELVTIFEQLLFGEALKLVGEADSELLMTIHYPFMPRVGDSVNDQARGPSTVVERKLEEKEDGKLYMLVSLTTDSRHEPWDTEFMIPA